ncbi:hypothetical protein QQX10_02305 [Demequina sp. SYSU T00039]|uniref:Uncharacterized protein n=1 Tax=Demequina lignilytica TaxID=3051663 RepID=A0AAW7M535_9MICO|nr:MULTISPECIES: hypothetical protein [unclassified Demequina]MDN4478502.1 hypothetical protein [Demequina sp. SYSU T00039-1]MDN4486991.1 hypothetical protein [Demequina sp. SYSU T00039]
MDAVRTVRTRARHDVAALDESLVPSTRALRDVRVAALTRHAPGVVRRAMRDEGSLRPWWDRSPLLILAAPLVLAYAIVFGDPGVGLIGAALLGWGVLAEPRLNRRERIERQQLLTVYRNTVADALVERAHRLAR